MAEPRRVPSSIFRVTYVTLGEPVAVTVLGRVIGWYTPVPRPGQDAVATPAETPGRTEAPDTRTSPASITSPSSAAEGALHPERPAASMAGMSQRDKDRVLGRVAKGRTS